MKKLILVIALGLAGIATLPAHAATATGNFDVTINLTSTCKYAKTSDVVFNYTSFQASAQAQTTAGGFTVQCTKTLPYSLSLDSTAVTDDAVDLDYTLALSATSGTGNGNTQAYSVTGSIAANQAGKCSTVGGSCSNAAATNKTRTLTITY